MQAEIIALGTELTNGSKLDTNSQWLSSELAALGVEVVRHATIADSMEDMIESLRSAARRVQLVIITGGLGPTLDDLTRQAMADAAGVTLQLNQESLEHLESLFTSRNREMPERNRIQAMFPAGAKPVPNPNGTAPGIDQRFQAPNCKHTCRFVALPGVPSEMKPMFHKSIAPELAGTGVVIRKARINCFGAGESKIEEMLGDLTARGNDPEVGITASQATITMRINARGTTVEECEQKIANTRAVIEDKLGNLVFGYENEELPDVIIRDLMQRDLTVSVIEVATAGCISEWLHARDIDGRCVAGGLVLGTGNKAQTLVPLEAMNSAKDLAKHARDIFGSDFGVAVGPMVNSKVVIAVSSPSGATATELSVLGDPAIRQSRLSKAALNKLRLRLARS